MQTFSLQDAFGVSHPNQLIDFDVAQTINPHSTYMLGPDGDEVPYQVLQGSKIAIQTDLPAHSERTWKLYAGKAPAPVEGGVKMTRGETYYEITSDLIGVRIPVPTDNLPYTLAPIQGLRYRDGTWTATGPNYIAPSAKRMNVRFHESGPLRVRVEVSYTYDRLEYVHKGRGTPPEGVRYAAGAGYCRSTLTIQAGQPSILIEEDTDMDVAYSLNVYDGLQPDQARYRGHHASSKATGYEADGQQYRAWHERNPMDAFVDLSYAAPTNHRPRAVWDPWIFDSGWYWQMYDTTSPSNANLFGIFAGPASRAMGAANSGVSVFTAPWGVRDLVTQTDAAGNIHTVYQSGDDLWYVRFDTSLAPSKPEKMATGLLYADLLVTERGAVYVVAFDRVQARFVQVERDAQGRFTVSPLGVPT